MEFALVGVIGVATVVAVAAFAGRLGVAAPLVLVVVGVIVSFLPGLPSPLQIPPGIILGAVLPPLLYAAAVQTPLTDFRRNFRAISFLSVYLVIGTTLVVGFLLYAILPHLNLAAAFALGAVVSPTDAVAATAVAKKLGLPARVVTVLEGESLVNDASALVLLKSAIAATGAGVSLLGVAGDFVFSAAAAVAVGLVVGALAVWVRSKLADAVLETAVSFAVPFVAYIPAEALGASGVLAVVVAGILSGHVAPKRFSAQARISQRLTWRTVQFLLENGVFLVMGLQLKTIIGQVPDDELGVFPSVALGILVVVVVLAVRALFVVPVVVGVRRQTGRASAARTRIDGVLDRIGDRLAGAPGLSDRRRRQLGHAARILRRREADAADLEKADIGWRGGAVLIWSGLRGVVTLAAAQSLPEDTPYRSQLILIAFTVAISTLLLQGGTLPVLIRVLRVRGTDASADRRALAALLDQITESGLRALDADTVRLADGSEASEEIVERVRTETRLGVQAAHERAEQDEDSSAPPGPHQQYEELRAEVLAAQRDALIEARSDGSYPSRVVARAGAMLDLEEARLWPRTRG